MVMQYTIRKEILCSSRITIEVGSKKQVFAWNSLNIHEIYKILWKIILIKIGNVIYRWKGNVELVKSHNRFVIQISTSCPEFVKYSWEKKIWKIFNHISYGHVSINCMQYTDQRLMLGKTDFCCRRSIKETFLTFVFCLKE